MMPPRPTARASPHHTAKDSAYDASPLAGTAPERPKDRPRPAPTPDIRTRRRPDCATSHTDADRRGSAEDAAAPGAGKYLGGRPSQVHERLLRPVHATPHQRHRSGKDTIGINTAACPPLPGRCAASSRCPPRARRPGDRHHRGRRLQRRPQAGQEPTHGVHHRREPGPALDGEGRHTLPRLGPDRSRPGLRHGAQRLIHQIRAQEIRSDSYTGPVHFVLYDIKTDQHARELAAAPPETSP